MEEKLKFTKRPYQQPSAKPVIRIDPDAMAVLLDAQWKTGLPLTQIASTMIRFAKEHTEFVE